MNISSEKQHVVLLADDNVADQRLFQRALLRHDPDIDLRVVSDGEEVMDYLKHRGPYRDPNTAPKPDLVLLDINMPRMDGKRTLREIREDHVLKGLPVVFMTTSDDGRDVRDSYELGVNAYLVKSPNIDEFFSAMETVVRFWLGVAWLPTKMRQMEKEQA